MRRRHRRRRTCCVRSYPKPPGTRWRPGAGAAPGVAGRGASQSCRRSPPPRQRSSGRPRPRCRRRHGTPPRGERGRWSPRQQRAAHPRSQCRRQSRSWRCRAGSRCRGSRQLRLPPQCTAELRRQCRYARQPWWHEGGSERRLPWAKGGAVLCVLPGDATGFAAAEARRLALSEVLGVSADGVAAPLPHLRRAPATVRGVQLLAGHRGGAVAFLAAVEITRPKASPP